MINFSFRFVVCKEYLRLSSVECVRSTGFFGAQRDQIRIGRQPKYRETSHLSCFWIEKEVRDGFFSLFPSATSLGYTIHVAVPICEEDRGCRWQQCCQNPCASWVLKRPPNPKLCGSTFTVVTSQIGLLAHLRRQYPVAVSYKYQNFKPYLAGYEGIYWFKLYLPWNALMYVHVCLI